MAAQSPQLSGTDALVAGSVAIAMHEMPEATVATVQGQLDAIANTIRSRFRSDSIHATLAHAHAVLFEELGFDGSTPLTAALAEGLSVGSNDPLDSYLPAVLDRKRGLPILIALVYKLVLERLDVPVHGLNTPGRFLVGVEVDDSIMVVDPAFAGRVLTAREVFQIMVGDSVPRELPAEAPLPVANHREWLQRMLRNLMGVFGARNRPTEFAAMVELKNLLEP